jgi:hypothetical protein
LRGSKGPHCRMRYSYHLSRRRSKRARRA